MCALIKVRPLSIVNRMELEARLYIVLNFVCVGDILLQGKMYITDRYLCFYSRIIHYVTKHVHRWEDIQTVTKERVAFIFPTAIGIRLKSNGKRMIYASFISRDQAYDKIRLIWSRAMNCLNSFDDDESTQNNDGTLKANMTNPSLKYCQQNVYNSADRVEQGDRQRIYSQNRMDSVSSKSSNDKSEKNAKFASQLLNDTMTKTDRTNRHSRYSATNVKQNDNTRRT
jgi:hypothetical protein